MANLPLTSAVDVLYTISPISAPRRNFDLGLIIGNSDAQEDRVVEYGGLQEVIDAGFANDSPEYQAAVFYFGATSNPRQLAIGRQFSGETPLQALQACRVANTEWYVAFITTAADEDQEDIAEYIEAIQPYSTYFLQTDSTAVKDGDPGNLFENLKGQQFERTLGLYSAEPYAVASIMGYAMGQTSNLANSDYTLKFKQMPGVEVDDLTTQEVENIEDNNGNVYINLGNFYTWFENGTMFNGSFFDQVIGLDKLGNNIQLNVADLLYQLPKVPQTEQGMAAIKSVIAQACDISVNIGFIAPGQWNGSSILTLKSGDYLPAGYLVLSESIDSQSQADRDARKAPPIYVPVKLAGAIHSVIIRIDVNR